MAWLILLLAAVFEITWAIALKMSDGFTKLIPSVVSIICMIVSIILLAIAVRKLPIGTAYAAWTGIGAAGVAIIGILWLGESRDPIKLISIVLVVVGIVGLKISSGTPADVHANADSSSTQ